jgi:hypothetical protein
VITIQCNGTIRIILVNKNLGVETKRPQILVCYDMMEGLIDEEEDLIFETELELFSIGTITISDETISLLSVGVTKIKINGESEPKERISDKKTTEVMALTTKITKFNVKPKTSMEDKVYLEIYYHHNQANIEVDETPTKFKYKTFR